MGSRACGAGASPSSTCCLRAGRLGRPSAASVKWPAVGEEGGEGEQASAGVLNAM